MQDPLRPSIPGKDTLDRALDRVEQTCPDRLARSVRWLRAPHRRWIRLPTGILFIAGGMLWFLPILGLEMLPIGLALVAVDVPLLQRPVGRAILWLEARWARLRARRARGMAQRRRED